MKRKINIAVLYGSIFQGNMGCNALTYSAISILEQVAQSLNLEFKYILSENSISDASFIPTELKFANVEVVGSFYKSFKKLAKSFIKRQLDGEIREKKLIDKADICFCTTGGDSFSDIYGPRFYEITKTIEYPMNRGKPLIMLPQTIGPFKAEKARRRAISVLKRAKAIFTRDPISTEYVRQLVPQVDLYESIDMAFFMNYESQKAKTEKIRVGINPSGLLWNGGYTKNNQFNLKANYQEVVRRIIEYFMQFDNVQIELVGHVLAGPYYNGVEDDYRVCKILKNAYPNTCLAPYFYTPTEAKSHISGLDFLISSRMHCCIAAYSSGVPVFPLAYSRKFSGLFLDKLRYGHLSDLTVDDVSSTLGKLTSAYSDRDILLNQMYGRVSELEGYKKAFIDSLRQLVIKYVRL